MLRAGVEGGHITKEWAAALDKRETFNDYFMSGVPRPSEWSEQRPNAGRIEFSPYWDRLEKALQPRPTIVAINSVRDGKPPGRGYGRGR